MHPSTIATAKLPKTAFAAVGLDSIDKLDALDDTVAVAVLTAVEVVLPLDAVLLGLKRLLLLDTVTNKALVMAVTPIAEAAEMAAVALERVVGGSKVRVLVVADRVVNSVVDVSVATFVVDATVLVMGRVNVFGAYRIVVVVDEVAVDVDVVVLRVTVAGVLAVDVDEVSVYVVFVVVDVAFV